jgi:hypothetical protein
MILVFMDRNMNTLEILYNPSVVPVVSDLIEVHREGRKTVLEVERREIQYHHDRNEVDTRILVVCGVISEG